MARMPIWLAAFAIALTIAGCRQDVLLNVVDEPYRTEGAAIDSALSLDDIEAAIVRGGARRNWAFTPLAPGHLEGKVSVRGKHHVTVDVLFDTEKFSILYKDAQGMNYNRGLSGTGTEENFIHPNYNTWVRLLADEIRAEVRAARPS